MDAHKYVAVCSFLKIKSSFDWGSTFNQDYIQIHFNDLENDKV